MDATTLPDGQRACYEAILAHIEEMGTLPTVRELGCRLGISSPNAIVGHLEALQRKGFTERTHRGDSPGGRAVSRTICPVGFRDLVRALVGHYKVRAGVGA